MASTTASRLLRLQIAILLGLLALSISATARPCRTFFISSYYSVSFRHPSSAATLTTFTEIRSLIPVHIVGNDNNFDKPSLATEIFFDRALPAHPLQEEEHEPETERRASQVRAPFGFSSDDFSSIRDRTKDILSVVVALLFGVGCGALTAATLYMVWSLFSNRYDYRDSFGDDEEIDSPKKMGYVKIPAVESLPAPAKEVV